MPPTIQVLVERCRGAKGAEYFTNFKALSNYVHQLSDIEFAQEINLITDPLIYGTLWSVGLSYKRQTILWTRIKELEK